MRFDFGGTGEIEIIREQLAAFFGPYADWPRLDPFSQLVKSLISSRTKDAVSLQTYQQLVQRYPHWSHAVAVPAQELEKTIAAVTFADRKASHLAATIQKIAASHPDFRLEFLGDWPIEAALCWLERLPGVARKVASATLNFSTLRRPAFVVDTHVLRVLQRLGFIGPNAAIEAGYHVVMAATDGYDAAQLTYLHSLLKRLGQTICEARAPRCGRCPIRSRCPARSC